MPRLRRTHVIVGSVLAVSAATILTFTARGWAGQDAARCAVPPARPSAPAGWLSPGPGTGGQGGGGPVGSVSPVVSRSPARDKDWRNDAFKAAGCKAWRRMHHRPQDRPAPSPTAAIKP